MSSRRRLFRNKGGNLSITAKQEGLRQDLLDAGLLQKMDWAFALAHEGADATKCLINLTGNRDFDLLHANGTLQDSYLQGIGISGSVNNFWIPYIPAIHGVNWTLNDAGFGYQLNVGNGNPTILSSSNQGVSGDEGSAGCIGTNLGGFDGRVYINNAVNINTGRGYIGGVPNAFFCTQRSGNSIKSYLDGVLKNTSSQAPQELSTIEIGLFNVEYKSFIWLGSSLSDAEQATLNAILKSYVNNL